MFIEHAGKIFKNSPRQVLTVNVWTWRKPKRSMTRLIFEVKDWPKVVFVKLLHNARWFQNKSQLYFRLLDIESACIYPPAWGGLSGSNSCSGLLFGCQFPRTAIPFIFPNMQGFSGPEQTVNDSWVSVLNPPSCEKVQKHICEDELLNCSVTVQRVTSTSSDDSSMMTWQK